MYSKLFSQKLYTKQAKAMTKSRRALCRNTCATCLNETSVPQTMSPTAEHNERRQCECCLVLQTSGMDKKSGANVFVKHATMLALHANSRHLKRPLLVGLARFCHPYTAPTCMNQEWTSKCCCTVIYKLAGTAMPVAKNQRSTTYLARLHATLTDVDNGKSRHSSKGLC